MANKNGAIDKTTRIAALEKDLANELYKMGQAEIRVNSLREQIQQLRGLKSEKPKPTKLVAQQVLEERAAQLNELKLHQPGDGRNIEVYDKAIRALTNMKTQLDTEEIRVSEAAAKELDAMLNNNPWDLQPGAPLAGANKSAAAQQAKPQPAAQQAKPQPAAQQAKPQPAAQQAVDDDASAALIEQLQMNDLVDDEEHHRLLDRHNEDVAGRVAVIAEFLGKKQSEITQQIIDMLNNFDTQKHAATMRQRIAQVPKPGASVIVSNNRGTVKYSDGSSTLSGVFINDPTNKRVGQGQYCFLIALWYHNYDAYFRGQGIHSPFSLAQTILGYWKLALPVHMYEHQFIDALAKKMRVTIAVTIQNNDDNVYPVNPGQAVTLGVTLNNHHYTNGLER